MCLFVATKFTGECTVEFNNYKQATLDNVLGATNTIAFEKFIMNCLEWKCSFVTTVEILDTLFVGYFIDVAEDIKKKVMMIVDFCLTGMRLF